MDRKKRSGRSGKGRRRGEEVVEVVIIPGLLWKDRNGG